jgi:16S rRNA (guanine966-N2)-methyltransferase
VRIVAGKFRRRKLLSTPGQVTRPLPDRVKESLFERLASDVAGKRIADVFAGTGTIGLEALSRGASSVVFIEHDKRAFDLLKQNVATLGVEDNALCWRVDVLRTSFRPKGVEHLLPYDTIFFDPPYRMVADIRPGTPLYRSLERLARDGVTAPGALLVLRTPEQSRFTCPPCWEAVQTLEFTTMDVHLFESRPPAGG